MSFWRCSREVDSNRQIEIAVGGFLELFLDRVFTEDVSRVWTKGLVDLWGDGSLWWNWLVLEIGGARIDDWVIDLDGVALDKVEFRDGW